MNFCRECRQDFGSVSAFDAHRVGKHAYTYREGLALGREDGRRCLDTAELAGLGWAQDSRRRWRRPGGEDASRSFRQRRSAVPVRRAA